LRTSYIISLKDWGRCEKVKPADAAHPTAATRHDGNLPFTHHPTAFRITLSTATGPLRSSASSPPRSSPFPRRDISYEPRLLAMPLLAVASSTRAAAVRPLRASAASGEAVPAPAAAAAETAGRRPVKVILPKKKPQKWSTGMEPGEYGGGPATIKPRKYWWGKEDRDPVANTDDFIWNKDFLPHMERVIANAEPTITRLTPVCTPSSRPRTRSLLVA
jgi:hypothetical protein